MSITNSIRLLTIPRLKMLNGFHSNRNIRVLNCARQAKIVKKITPSDEHTLISRQMNILVTIHFYLLSITNRSATNSCLLFV